MIRLIFFSRYAADVFYVLSQRLFMVLHYDQSDSKGMFSGLGTIIINSH